MESGDFVPGGPNEQLESMEDESNSGRKVDDSAGIPYLEEEAGAYGTNISRATRSAMRATSSGSPQKSRVRFYDANEATEVGDMAQYAICSDPSQARGDSIDQNGGEGHFTNGDGTSGLHLSRRETAASRADTVSASSSHRPATSALSVPRMHDSEARPRTAMMKVGIGLQFDVADFIRAQEAKSGRDPLYMSSSQSSNSHPTTASRDALVDAWDGSSWPVRRAPTMRGVQEKEPAPMEAMKPVANKADFISNQVMVLFEAVESIEESSKPDVADEQGQSVQEEAEMAYKAEAAMGTQMRRRGYIRGTEQVYQASAMDKIQMVKQAISTPPSALKWSQVNLSGMGGDVNTVVRQLTSSLSAHPSLLWVVDLSNNALAARGISACARSLSTVSSLVSLNVCNNVTVPAYINGLCEASPEGLLFSESLIKPLLAQCGTNLISLNISGNWIRAEGALLIAPALYHNSLLTSLNISNNNLFKEGFAELAGPLTSVCTHLESLCLSSNWIGPLGVDVLNQILLANSNLHTLDIAQNGIGAAGTMSMTPVLRKCGPQFKWMEMEDNNLDAQAQRNLFPAVLDMTSLTYLGGLDFGTVGGFFSYVVGTRTGEKKGVHIDTITALDLSNAGFDEFPPILLGLTALHTLDVSGNRFKVLPYIYLCQMTALTDLYVDGNAQLVCPPPEIAKQGGVAVMEYLRHCRWDGRFQTEMVLFIVGDAEAGKTCLLDAIRGEPPRKEYLPTIGANMIKWTPQGEDGILSFLSMDLGGQALYSITHEFFLTNATYLLVFRALENNMDEDEKVASLNTSVKRWLTQIHLCGPRSSFITVITHVDNVDPMDVDKQCVTITESILSHLKDLEASLFWDCDRKIFRVSAVRGTGIEALKGSLCEASKKNARWNEFLTAELVRMRQRLDEIRVRDKLVEYDWSLFVAAAKECGVTSLKQLDDITTRLHEGLQMRFFGSVTTVTNFNSSQDLSSMSPLERTVYLDVFWSAAAFRGLIRPDRTPLLTYFGGRISRVLPDPEKLSHAKHMLVHGLVRKTFLKFLWPFQPLSKTYWDCVRDGHLGQQEAEIWSSRIAAIDEDYKPIQRLLESFGVIGELNLDEYTCPFLGTANQRRHVDVRGLTPVEGTPFVCTFGYRFLPACFFKRLAVRMMSSSHHSEICVEYSVHFSVNGRVLLSLRQDDGMTEERLLKIQATSRAVYDIARLEVSRIEMCYPGLQRSSISEPSPAELDEWDAEQRPPDVFVSHSSKCKAEGQGIRDAIRGCFTSLHVLASCDTKRQSNFSLRGARACVVLLDAAYPSSKRCLDELSEAGDSGCAIIPLVTHTYMYPEKEDQPGTLEYVRWYAKMDVFAEHRMYVDLRMTKELEEVAKAEGALAQVFEQHEAGTGGRQHDKLIEKNRSLVGDAQQILAEAYTAKVHREVMDLIQQILLRWRGPGGSETHSNFTEDEMNVPCRTCISAFVIEPDIFSRQSCKKKLLKFHNEELERKGLGEAKFSEPLVSCKRGHGQVLTSVLNDPYIWRAVPCPSCVRRDANPPYCFNYLKLLTYFEGTSKEPVSKDEGSIPFNRTNSGKITMMASTSAGRRGSTTSRRSSIEGTASTISGIATLTSHVTDVGGEDDFQMMSKTECPACTFYLNTRTMISVHSLLCPEVFISFHWGVALGENLSAPFSGHWQARAIRDKFRNDLDLFAFIDTNGPGDGDPGEHVKSTFAAIKGCSVFICLLSDAYANSRRCRREFERAVGTSKYIIPILLPQVKDIEGDLMKCFDGYVGWMGKPEGEDWWKHAINVSKESSDVAVRWSVLQHFDPLNFLEDERVDGDRRSVHDEDDIILRVEQHMFVGEHVKHNTKRIYRTWRDARRILQSKLKNVAGQDDSMLSDTAKAEARAARVFEMLDADGNGVIEKEELKEGLAKLGLAVDDALVSAMLAEADVDGNVGIDLEEFVDAILRVA